MRKIPVQLGKMAGGEGDLAFSTWGYTQTIWKAKEFLRTLEGRQAKQGAVIYSRDHPAPSGAGAESQQSCPPRERGGGRSNPLLQLGAEATHGPVSKMAGHSVFHVLKKKVAQCRPKHCLTLSMESCRQPAPHPGEGGACAPSAEIHRRAADPDTFRSSLEGRRTGRSSAPASKVCLFAPENGEVCKQVSTLRRSRESEFSPFTVSCNTPGKGRLASVQTLTAGGGRCASSPRLAEGS